MNKTCLSSPKKSISLEIYTASGRQNEDIKDDHRDKNIGGHSEVSLTSKRVLTILLLDLDAMIQAV